MLSLSPNVTCYINELNTSSHSKLSFQAFQRFSHRWTTECNRPLKCLAQKKQNSGSMKWELVWCFWLLSNSDNAKQSCNGATQRCDSLNLNSSYCSLNTAHCSVISPFERLLHFAVFLQRIQLFRYISYFLYYLIESFSIFFSVF